MYKGPGERLGISIRGGAKGHPGNPLDKSDEGIFVSKVNEGGVAFKDGRLKVGQRLLEVCVINFHVNWPLVILLITSFFWLEKFLTGEWKTKRMVLKKTIKLKPL